MPDDSNMFIGGNNNSKYFSGQIDEIRIWNYERTPNDIRKFMYIQLNRNEAGLAGYWHFENLNYNDLSLNGAKGIPNGSFSNAELQISVEKYAIISEVQDNYQNKGKLFYNVHGRI